MTLWMKREISRSLLEEAADLCSGELRTDYSGRSMYGRTCPGVVVDCSAVRLMVALTGVLVREAVVKDEDTEEAIELAEQLAEDMSTDNMGLGMIVYWPSWKLTV